MENNWKPPTKHGLNNSNIIIPNYYFSYRNGEKNVEY